MSDNKSELRVDGRGRVTLPKEMRDKAGAPTHYIAEFDDGVITLTPAQIEPLAGE